MSETAPVLGDDPLSRRAAARGEVSLDELARVAQARKQARKAEVRQSRSPSRSRNMNAVDRAAASQVNALNRKPAKRAGRRTKQARKAKRDQFHMMRGCLATPADKVGGAGAWLLLLHTIAHNRTGQYWLKPRADTATRNGFGRCLKGYKANMRTLREAGLLVSVQPVRPGYAVDAVTGKAQALVERKRLPTINGEAVRVALNWQPPSALTEHGGRAGANTLKAVLVKMAAMSERSSCTLSVDRLRDVATELGCQLRTVRHAAYRLEELGELRIKGGVATIVRAAHWYAAHPEIARADSSNAPAQPAQPVQPVQAKARPP